MNTHKTQDLIARLVVETTAPALNRRLIRGAHRRWPGMAVAATLLGTVTAAILLLQGALMLAH
jgi:hypothetical protein